MSQSQITKYKSAFYGEDGRGMVLYVSDLNEWFANSKILVDSSKVIIAGEQQIFDGGHFDNAEIPLRLKAALVASGAVGDDFQISVNRTSNEVSYEFVNPENVQIAAAFLSELKDYVKQGLVIKPKVALVVSGSIAAKKTGKVANALKARGFNVAYKVTDSAWQFVETKDKDKIPPYQLAEIRRNTDITDSSLTLVAPASASYISRMANGQITFPGKVFVAPAMNFMMWQHPATQANVRKLIDRGFIFLGPEVGPMACRDYGYGRFASSKAIAEALGDENHPLRKIVDDSIFKAPKIPSAIKPDAKDILLIVHKDDDSTVSAIKDLQNKGYVVKCVAAPGVDTSDFGVEVVKAHYESNTTPPGMEHIRLPEWADVVLMYATDAKYLAEMAQGSGSFIGDTYLASKAPVFVISSNPQPELEKHGVTVLNNYSEFDKALETAKQDLAGKHYLVLGGQPREVVDTFRFYANNFRAEDHGAKVAAELVARGARVTFICPFNSKSKPDGAIVRVNGREIKNVDDMLAQANELRDNFDGIIQLANISQFKCPNPANTKISKKSERAEQTFFKVIGNVDIISSLSQKFPEIPIIGYNNFQEKVEINSSGISPVIRQICNDYEQKPTKTDSSFVTNYSGKSNKKRAVITTSRTEESMTKDGVILTNPFSGKQGQDLAITFANRGWDVVLISGPTYLSDLQHPKIRNVHVTSMAEMLKAAQRETLVHADAYISAAAIADFSIQNPLDVRLKPEEEYQLVMQENPSVVGTISKNGNAPSVMVSFAAQSPEQVVEYALQKFKKLGTIQLTVANAIGPETVAAKDSSRNQVHFITQKGVETLPEMSKLEVANRIFDVVETLLERSKQR